MQTWWAPPETLEQAQRTQQQTEKKGTQSAAAQQGPSERAGRVIIAPWTALACPV